MGSDEKVLVKILHVTSAFDSFIQASLLPLLLPDTGSSVPALGVGMKISQVPLHNVMS